MNEAAAPATALDRSMVFAAAGASLKKLDPRVQVRKELAQRVGLGHLDRRELVRLLRLVGLPVLRGGAAAKARAK